VVESATGPDAPAARAPTVGKPLTPRATLVKAGQMPFIASGAASSMVVRWLEGLGPIGVRSVTLLSPAITPALR
jgi:hypothetical protein